MTGDISDTFDIGTGSETYVVRDAFSVIDDASVIVAFAAVGLDVFVYNDTTSGKFYLAYETADGGENAFGTLETVELVGIVDSFDMFSVSLTGVVSFIDGNPPE